jgi:LacI family transcriptional regulator
MTPKDPPNTPRAPAQSASISIATVAAKAGVSIATVSRVLNGLSSKFSKATQTKVLQAVDELGYRPTVAARTLRSGQSRLVALLASNMANPSMASIAAAAEVALRKSGYVMVLCDTHDQPEQQDEYLKEMGSHNARAVVMLGAVDSPELRQLAKSPERIVFVNRHAPVPIEGERFVGIDNRQAVLDVAQWMHQRRQSPMALIHGDVRSSATRERVDGFVAACKSLKQALPRSHICFTPGVSHLDIGYLGMKQLMTQKKPPLSVFCTSDLIAYGAHRCLHELHPRYLSLITLVGFDHSPLNDWIAPWLHGIRVPYESYGQAIVSALDSDKALNLLLPHQWVNARTASAL